MNFAIKATKLSRDFKRRNRNAGFLEAIKAFVSPQYIVKNAVRDMSFEIPQGSCVGVVGANGAGKTTLLKMIAGLLHPTHGELETLGFKPSKREHRFLHQIGMVMGQKSQLWVDIPAADTFELLGAFYKIPKKQLDERVKQLSELFAVDKLLGVQVRRLSLGERMKLEIIASLLHEPQLLILDEPTIGLDVLAQHKIREFIKSYNREKKTTILLSSHHMDDITEVCDRLMIISHGTLRFHGTLADFNKQKGTFTNLIRELISEGES